MNIEITEEELSDGFKIRLKEAISVTDNGSVNGFADKSGIAKSLLRTYFDENRTTWPSIYKVHKIAETANVSIEWLLYGRGEGPIEKLSDTLNPERYISGDVGVKEWIEIDSFDTEKELIKFDSDEISNIPALPSLKLLQWSSCDNHSLEILIDVNSSWDGDGVYLFNLNGSKVLRTKHIIDEVELFEVGIKEDKLLTNISLKDFKKIEVIGRVRTGILTIDNAWNSSQKKPT